MAVVVFLKIETCFCPITVHVLCFKSKVVAVVVDKTNTTLHSGQVTKWMAKAPRSCAPRLVVLLLLFSGSISIWHISNCQKVDSSHHYNSI